jgi:hypothetical protein
MNKVSINPLIQSKTRLISHAHLYTWYYDSILVLSASSYPVASNLLANWVTNKQTNKQTNFVVQGFFLRNCQQLSWSWNFQPFVEKRVHYRVREIQSMNSSTFVTYTFRAVVSWQPWLILRRVSISNYIASNVRSLVWNERERTCKESAVTYSKHSPGICLEALRKSTKNLSQDSRCPEYKFSKPSL